MKILIFKFLHLKFTINHMHKVSTLRLKIFTAIGFVTILIPVLPWILWIHCYNSRNNYADRVEMYHNYFPEFLNGRYTISQISFIICFTGIILSLIYFRKKSTILKIISIIMSIAGVLILAVLIVSVPRTINKIDYEKFKNAQDYSVPLFDNSEKNKTALFIFPHPDDEVVCGGTIDQMKKIGWTIDLLTLTKGESEGKAIRNREWENAVKELHIDNYEILELPNNSWDNVLKNDIEFWYDNQDSIENIVYQAILKYKPSVVFTFDTVFGAYGHPEHRISAIAVNNVFQKHKADSVFSVELILQITFPENLEQLVFGSLESYKNAMKYTGNITLPDPTIAYDISNNGTAKRKAAAAYVSQAVGLKRSYLLPEPADTAIHYSTFNREYYFEIKK